MKSADHKRPGTNRSRNKPGPKPVVPTDALRNLVMLMVAIGMTGDQIADAIEISRPTLYRTYGHELATGRAKKLLISVARLDDMANAGNVSAAKFLHMLMMERGSKPETAVRNEWEELADEISAGEGNSRQSSDFGSVN